jgi:nucleotide-binding universal stress UspA family protein
MIRDTKKMLFATDLSAACRNSYNYAVNLAMARQASITLLHVIETPPVSVEMRIKSLLGEDRYEEIMREHEKDTRSILIGKRKESEIIESALFKFCADSMNSSPGCFLQPDEIIVKIGEVVKEILSISEEKESDMIILSSHESAATSTSVSKIIQDVLRLSRVPVIIVPPAGN